MGADQGLFGLSPLVRCSAGEPILHVAAGERWIAVATSTTLLLIAPANAASSAPRMRHMQWFKDPLKGIASLAMRDDLELLVVTHDASAYLLPLRRLMIRSAPLPAGTPLPCCSTDSIAIDVHALVAVPSVVGDRAASVSCCALCEARSGPSVAIGSLEGTIHVIGFDPDGMGGTLTCTADAEVPIARLSALPSPSARVTRGAVTQPCDAPAGNGGALLVRTLQGRYLLMGLATSPPMLRPLVLPTGELSVQRSSSADESPWLLLHSAEECRLTVYTMELTHGGAMCPSGGSNP